MTDAPCGVSRTLRIKAVEKRQRRPRRPGPGPGQPMLCRSISIPWVRSNLRRREDHLSRVPGVDEDSHEYDDFEYDDDDIDGVEALTFSPVTLERFDLSDDGRLAVVGESYYQQALKMVASGRAIGYGFDEHLPVTAVLVPEPKNPHDGKLIHRQQRRIVR